MKALRVIALSIIMILLPLLVEAQITTSSISGTVMDTHFNLGGVEVLAIHEPTNTRYGTLTNASGHYFLNNLKAGGPYKLYFTYKNHYPEKYEEIYLRVGRDLMFDVFLEEKELHLSELTVTANAYNNMRIDQSGINRQFTSHAIESTPTLNHSMNDVIVLTPQSGIYNVNLSIGGGNFRQSYITVDGAGFNDVFGLNSNLPANGAPIALDALDQISVSLAPFDVRQSGFTGSQVNAITKSGTNRLSGSAYAYLTNENFKGDNVSGTKVQRNHEVRNILGFTLGGPIIKDKLFFFTNFEYEKNTESATQAVARTSASESFGEQNIHRTLSSDLDNVSSYLKSKYGYDAGAYQGYSFRWPNYRGLFRLDWNINEFNNLNVRYTYSKTRSNALSPSSSISPMSKTDVYPGDASENISAAQTSTSIYGMFYEGCCYYTDKTYSTLSAELKSQFENKKFSNLLRYTNSYQREARHTYGSSEFPMVDILQDGASYINLGMDKFSYQNKCKVYIHNLTDEFSIALKAHKLIFGLSAEKANIHNDFHQFGNGFYVYNSLDDFMNNAKPSTFGFAFANDGSESLPSIKFNYLQLSGYVQDQFNVTKDFKITAGVRLDKYVHYNMGAESNKNFEQLDFGGTHYTTNNTPSKAFNFSPRVGFNWDLTGERKIILRGGTGIFFAKIPNVWLASETGNSNVLQTIYTETGSDVPDVKFYTDRSEILQSLKQAGVETSNTNPAAGTNTCVIDKNLIAPYSWKSSLAVDFKLPNDFELSVEGIYKKDYKPLMVKNNNVYYDGSSTVQLSENDVRKSYSKYNKENCYYLTNGRTGAYYTSLNISLKKQFGKHFDASANFTYSHSLVFTDGSSSQMASIYSYDSPCVNGVNDGELGYASYISPYRCLVNVGYKFNYGKKEAWGTHINLVYNGAQVGFYNDGSGYYMASRYSYLMSNNFVNDGASSNLMYIPASKDELTFKDKDGYSAEQQAEDFWNFVNQDSYLSKHKGEYAKRGGATMPWHHQFDLHINEEYNFKINNLPQCFEFGVDVINFTNIISNRWGNYKKVNTINPLTYMGDQSYTFNKVATTYSKYEDLKSTYQILVNLKYKF